MERVEAEDGRMGRGKGRELGRGLMALASLTGQSQPAAC